MQVRRLLRFVAAMPKVSKETHSTSKTFFMPLQLVPIDELQLGSYVIAVTRQQGDVIVKDAGWVRSDEAIALLRQRGVLEVQIDTAKQLPPAKPSPEPMTAAPAAVKKAPKILFEQEVNKASLALQANVQSASIALPALVQHHIRHCCFCSKLGLNKMSCCSIVYFVVFFCMIFGCSLLYAYDMV